VIVVAAPKEFVNAFLAAAARARLDIVGMNIEPKAIVDCFSHVYRRKVDGEATTCFLDIGLSSSRAVIARANQVLFARVIPVGGEHFNTAVAHALRINLDAAKLLRLQLASAPAAEAKPTRATVSDETSMEQAMPLLSAALGAKTSAQTAAEPVHAQATLDPAAAELAEQMRRVDEACHGPLMKLVEELDLCRRYYESTFPSKPVDRLVFLGGEARQRSLCQQIAQEMGLAAQLGDPLVRMNRVSDVGVETGIDRRYPQPGWSVAIGLSLGPTQAATPAAAAAAG
jgi:Tfp pilus assembly PilM family ATPase